MSQVSGSVRLASSVYRLSLSFLPREFLSRFGAELVACFENIAEEARGRGRLAVAGVTIRSVLDLVMHGSRQHLVAARAGAIGPGGWWIGGWQDLHQAARRLWRRPSFTLVSVVTLALGIAAATSVFSLVNGVVLSPLPYPASDRIVQVDHGGRGLGVERGLGITYGFYRFYAEHVRTAEAMAMYSFYQPTLTGAGEPVQLEAARVTTSLGAVLGVPPRLGRWFTVEEGRPGASPAVVLSHRLWGERFSADPAVLGRVIELDGIGHEVVGVMPASFAFPGTQTGLWIPRAVPATGIGGWGERAIARLLPTTDAAAMERELASLFPRLREDPSDPSRVATYLDDAGVFPRIVELRDDLTGDVRDTLWVLLGTVAFLLLIAVANVANLFLVRAEEGQREAAVRTALGAARGRLVRGNMAETMLLALAAATLGLAGAAAVVRLLRLYAPVNIPRLHEVELNPEVVVAALAVTLLVAVLLGLMPALRRGGDLGEALKESGRRTTAARSRLQGRSVLVATQVALALVLLIGSGLLLRTFAALRAVDLGFAERQALVFDIGLPGTRYPTRAQAKAFHDRLQERLAGLPGIERVGAVGRCLPLVGYMCQGEVLDVEGRPAPEGKVPPVTGARVVTTDYFRTLGITVRGRAFTPADEAGAATAVILSRSAAEAYFPGEDPIGRRVRLGSSSPWHTVVGVANNVRGRVETDDFQRLIYLPVLPEAKEGPHPSVMSYVLATAVPPGSVQAIVQRVVHELDLDLPLANVRTLQGVIDDATAPTAFALTLVTLAAGIALLLGAVGVYAVIAYAVSRRTAEIGVRLALGANASDVRWMVLRQGSLVVLAGIGVGLVGAFALTRTLRGMLFGVSPTDFASYAVLTGLMLVVALLALYLPARRASRVDPLEALRTE
jgi:putative ABC transport system permease protein